MRKNFAFRNILLTALLLCLALVTWMAEPALAHEPSTYLTMTASSETDVKVGDTVLLTITETNDSLDPDRLLSPAWVELQPLGIILNQDSPSFTSNQDDDAILAVGETWKWVVPVVITGDTMFVATGHGYWAGWDYWLDETNDPDERAVVMVQVVPPPPTTGLEITKQADVPFTKVGDSVNYTIVVTNTGEVELVDVRVMDSLLGVLMTGGVLAPHENVQLVVAYVVPGGAPNPLLNVATATAGVAGTTATVGPVQASVELRLVHPSITLEKKADPDIGAIGDVITYTITIANTGDVDLEHVTVTDSLLGDLSDSFIDYLAVGQSTTQQFRRAIVAGDPNPLVNSARVDANVIILGNSVSGEDSARVAIVGNQGCTPGFWKNNALQWGAVAWVGYTPRDSFNDVFGVSLRIRGNGKDTIARPTLLDALGANGGGINALTRHATAALLNIANPNVAYPIGAKQLIASVQNAVVGGDAAIEELASQLDRYNNAGAPINQQGVLITP